MKIYKASNIGTGISIPYQAIEFENNMRVTSPFTIPINDSSSAMILKKYYDLHLVSAISVAIIFRRADRQYHDLFLCPVRGCTASFESNVELDSHVASNQHFILKSIPRTANDIARVHLTEILRSTRSQTRAQAVPRSQDAATCDFSNSFHNNYISICGWALRKRKLGKPMSETVRDFIEQLWLKAHETHSRFSPENIQEELRAKRHPNGKKMFQTQDYPTKNQILYQCRKFQQKYGIDGKQKLIAEIIDQHTELQTDK